MVRHRRMGRLPPLTVRPRSLLIGQPGVRNASYASGASVTKASKSTMYSAIWHPACGVLEAHDVSGCWPVARGRPSRRKPVEITRPPWLPPGRTPWRAT